MHVSAVKEFWSLEDVKKILQMQIKFLSSSSSWGERADALKEGSEGITVTLSVIFFVSFHGFVHVNM